MKIAGRQKEILEYLGTVKNVWVKPAAAGGTRHSHHAGTLNRLCAKGFATRKTAKITGNHEYRITPAGRQVLEDQALPMSRAEKLIRQVLAMVGDTPKQQAAAANWLGVGQPSVSRYLEGSPPEPAVIFRACLALLGAGVQPDGYRVDRCEFCGVVSIYEGDRLIYSGPPPVAAVTDAATVTG